MYSRSCAGFIVDNVGVIAQHPQVGDPARSGPLCYGPKVAVSGQEDCGPPVSSGLASMRDGLAVCRGPLHFLFGPFQLALYPDAGKKAQARRDIQAALDFATRQQADILVDRARTSLGRL